MDSPTEGSAASLATTVLEDMPRDFTVALGGGLARNWVARQRPGGKQFALETSHVKIQLIKNVCPTLFAFVRCTATSTLEGEGDGVCGKVSHFKAAASKAASATPQCYDTMMG